MSGTIPATYRETEESEGLAMTLPYQTEANAETLGTIEDPNGVKTVLFSQESDLGFWIGHSVESQWGDQDGDVLTATTDPRDALILGVGNDLYVCRKKMAYPFICVDPDADDPVEIVWIDADDVEDYMADNDRLALTGPLAESVLRRAGFHYDVPAIFHVPGLAKREGEIESELYDVLEDLDNESNAMSDYATGDRKTVKADGPDRLGMARKLIRSLQETREQMEVRSTL